MPFKSKRIEISEAERIELETISRSTRAEHRMVHRSKIILLLASGKTYSEIQQELSTNHQSIAKWKKRYIAQGIKGLSDLSGRGSEAKYSKYDEARVINLSCSKPEDGSTTWSQSRIAKKLGMSQSTVSRILKKADLKPHKTEYWCGKSTDTEFESKMLTIIGLYMSPPTNAIVLCVDEKTQIQALDRTQPELPMRRGNPKRLTATYKRNGTTALIAALAVHSGEITANTIESNNTETFLSFLKKLDRKYRNKHLHIIVDNHSTHKNKIIKEWMSHKRKITMHFTPTYSSWLNMIEIWFGILTKDVLKNAVWKSKQQLVKQLIDYIKMYNKERIKPFNWTYDPYKMYSKTSNE